MVFSRTGAFVSLSRVQDKNGVVDKDEFRRCMRTLKLTGYDHPDEDVYDNVCDDVFSRIDHDKSGRSTLSLLMGP